MPVKYRSADTVRRQHEVRIKYRAKAYHRCRWKRDPVSANCSCLTTLAEGLRHERHTRQQQHSICGGKGHVRHAEPWWLVTAPGPPVRLFP